MPGGMPASRQCVRRARAPVPAGPFADPAPDHPAPLPDMDIENLSTYFLFCVTSLLAIINPLTTAPIYLSMTEGYTAAHRQHTLRIAILTGALVLWGFSLLGGTIFLLFGITIDAFRIAGGIILFGIGMDMLQARRSRVRTTAEEEQEGMEKEEIGITPLGVPMIVGPGSITTAMVLMADAASALHVAALMASVALVLGGTYVVLKAGAALVHAVGRTGLNVMTRIMGLLVAVIAVQFIVDGARPILVDIIRSARVTGGG